MMPELDDAFKDSSEESKGETEAEETKGADKAEEEESDEDPATPAGKSEEESEEESKETDDADKDPDKGAGKADEAEPESEDGKSVVPVAALKDERNKRQSFETENKQLKERLAKYEKGETAVVEDDVDDDTFKERAETSREIMNELVSDYAEKETVFLELCKAEPLLALQMRRSKSPAKFAYEKAKEHIEHKQYLEDRTSDQWKEFQEFKKDPAKYAEKLAKQAEESPDDKRKKSALKVSNLNKATSANVDSAKDKVETLDEMFGDDDA